MPTRAGLTPCDSPAVLSDGIALPIAHETTQGGAPELAIVVPTFNEHENVLPLIELVRTALPSVSWELIFVDDNSPDGTAQAVREVGRHDARVRCIRRLGRRGLSSACTEGMLATGAAYLAVMDADLQHDPMLLGRMLEMMRRGVDLVVASRYLSGGSVGSFAQDRLRMSRLATRLARLVLAEPISDPMAGYFMLRREVVESTAERLSSLGFKILLDILASAPRRLRVVEVPLRFGTRHSGESKLSANVAWEFLLLIADKAVGRYVPVRFLSFGAIGAAGVGVHFAVLSIVYVAMRLPFMPSQAAATLAAMVFNYSVNNVLTYSHVSLRSWRWLGGLFCFVLICGLGAVANVGLASLLFREHAAWPMAAFAGIGVGAVWNYAVSSRYVWQSR